MTHKRYNYADEQFAQARKHNSIQLPEDATINQTAERLYERLGVRFPIKWDKYSTAEPKINDENLPNSISMEDVERVLSNMKTDGLI